MAEARETVSRIVVNQSNPNNCGCFVCFTLPKLRQSTQQLRKKGVVAEERYFVNLLYNYFVII